MRASNDLGFVPEKVTIFGVIAAQSSGTFNRFSRALLMKQLCYFAQFFFSVNYNHRDELVQCLD